ncbi:hypothetical protein BH11BAC4_BH11BAC4_12960 [soil metagenome]
MKKNSDNSEKMQSNDAATMQTETISLQLATDIKSNVGKFFSNAELWNIQRRRKSFSQRRQSC